MHVPFKNLINLQEKNKIESNFYRKETLIKDNTEIHSKCFIYIITSRHLL